MRLKTFRVRTFRNIIDSGDIAVDDVTCLVGKNEAGKSAVLQALHQINPANHADGLVLLDEYPRWLKKEHEITGEIENAIPIEATFVLEDSERTELEELYGAGVVTSDEVTVKRRYGANDFTVEAPVDASAFVRPFVEALPQRLKDRLGAVDTTQALRSGLAAVAASGEDGDEGVAADATNAVARLNARLGEGVVVTAAITRHLHDRVPKTFYFSRYSSLRGRYMLDEVFNAVKSGTAEEEVAAAADFLRLARVVPQTIEEWDYEASNAELEAVSTLLTRRVKEHWHQNDHLKLRVSVETQPEGPNRAPVRYLQFRVEDTRHDFSSRLDRRSTGFQWFVSFIASFLEFEQDKNLILLLDEPGLSLHARAQMDLVDTIEHKLASDRQVLYTTHSPFMVRPAALAHVRIVENQGPDEGSLVTNDAGVVSDPDTLFPLQAALGYDIAQNIFVGHRNILVEGVSDFIYMTAVSDFLQSQNCDGLPADARLLPAGGATNIPTFIALVGVHLDIVVVLDGNTDGQRVENAIKRGRLDPARVITLDAFSSVSDADIEDLFTPAEYLALYNDAFGKNLKITDLKGKDRIVKRIARTDSGDFNHGVVAAHFLRNLDVSLGALSPETLDRFGALFTAIRQALPT